MPEQQPVDPDTGQRIEDAFAALLARDVPASAPRPATAPRPTDVGPRVTRRRLGLAGGGLLVAAAAVVLAVLIGSEVQQARPVPSTSAAVSDPPTTAVTDPPTSPSVGATPTTPAPSTQVSTPSAAEVSAAAQARAAAAAAAFATVSLDTRTDVIAVPGGFEGADLDAGTIRFWRSADGTSWDVDGTSSYPADVRGDGRTTYTATIRTAALLTGMDHASYLVYGEAFTGDSTGFVMIFADGADGWGVVKAGSDGDLHPSGAPVDPADQIGLMRDGGLAGGLLQTVDCSVPISGPLAECGDPANQVRKSWRWDGSRFVLDG